MEYFTGQRGRKRPSNSNISEFTDESDYAKECRHPENRGIYEELEKLRNLVEKAESQPNTTFKTTLDGSLMSTVFAVVLVMIISISIYAFTNLYRALVKRFS